MTAELDVAAIHLTDLLLDVLADMDSDGLSAVTEFADPLTGMLAAWALDVREGFDD
jgi:hypothetical protein